MGLKYHTLIFVPHSRAKYRKWRISNRQLALGLALLLLVSSGAVAIAWRSFYTTVNLEEIGRLRSENDALRTVRDEFEQSFRSLERQLLEFEDKSKTLAIVAGLEEATSSRSSYAGAGADAGTGGDLLEPPSGTLNLAELVNRTDLVGEQLDRAGERLADRRDRIEAMPTASPVRGILTSRYGLRLDPITGQRASHTGVDISARPGRPVVAAADGVVVRAGHQGSLGRAVVLSHRFGLSTRYGHLSKTAVAPGTHVKKGQIVGYVGNSGRATGYHLHYEVRLNGKPQDPLEYLLEF